LFRLFDSGETDTGMNHVRYLLDSQGAELEQSIRRGDLFAMITHHYASIGEIEKARAVIEELKRLIPGINLSYYFNVNLLEKLGFKINIKKEESADRDDDIEELLGE
jgi:antirestriction protein ArdC